MSSLPPKSINTAASKPRSNIIRGYGLQERSVYPNTVADLHALRDNFTISTWLLIGASLQCLLMVLPIRPSYALLPAVVILSCRLAKNLLQCFGIIRHPYADGVIPGKVAAKMPESYDKEGNQVNDGGVCVIMLFARSNHPLGIFAPYYKELADKMQSLVYDLDTNAPNNGFLGGNTFNNTSDRTTGSEAVIMCYFKTHEDVQAFAHGPHHREVWDWWNDLSRQKKVNHLSICHEVFAAPKGNWEGVYVNQYPSFFMGTNHFVMDKEGNEGWVDPVTKANKGRMRTAKGRLGRSDGRENEVYGEEPYAEV